MYQIHTAFHIPWNAGIAKPKAYLGLMCADIQDTMRPDGTGWEVLISAQVTEGCPSGVLSSRPILGIQNPAGFEQT